MGELLATVSSSELSEWMAFDSIEPFGEQRADLRAGIVASTVANHAMSPPRHPVRAADFMPFVRGARAANEPLRLADPVQHGKLIAESLFGKRLKKPQG